MTLKSAFNLEGGGRLKFNKFFISISRQIEEIQTRGIMDQFIHIDPLGWCITRQEQYQRSREQEKVWWEKCQGGKPLISGHTCNMEVRGGACKLGNTKS